MSDAPERIWANFRNWRNPHEGHCYKHDDLGGSEYVRADIVDALVAEKVREALTEIDEHALNDAGWKFVTKYLAALRDQKEPKV